MTPAFLPSRFWSVTEQGASFCDHISSSPKCRPTEQVPSSNKSWLDTTLVFRSPHTKLFRSSHSFHATAKRGHCQNQPPPCRARKWNIPLRLLSIGPSSLNFQISCWPSLKRQIESHNHIEWPIRTSGDCLARV